MKKVSILYLIITLILYTTSISAQETSRTKNLKKSNDWAASLELNNKEKEQHVANIILVHLNAIDDFYNAHPYTEIPEGVNPNTGEKLSRLERQLIISSTIPDSIHGKLMSGLRKHLTEQQVESILDKYTVGKVDFTMIGYRTIIPDLNEEEEIFILNQLKLAREQAIDYKSMDLISRIFKIYKTKCELYLYQQGRNWKALYKAYFEKQKVKKEKEGDKR